MKVLILTKYDHQGASSRLRMFQYFPFLESAGFELSVVPLLSQWYLDYIYSSGNSKIRWNKFFQAFHSRLRHVLLSRKFDLVWVQGEIFPWLPAFAEKILNYRNIPYVVDYDDAIFHRYDRHPWPMVRRALGNKIDAVMSRSAMVIAGNEYIAERATQAGATNIEILPTVVDCDRYQPKTDTRENNLFTVGWIGSPTTTPYLNLIAPALKALGSRNDVKLLLIGAGPITISGVAAEFHPWSEATEVDLLRHCDVGIMPLPDAPWERGKCGFKLIQYMACGLPVVASPVGINCRLVSSGENGFLASIPSEWEGVLNLLRGNFSFRQRMGAVGRTKVEREYSLQVHAPRLVQFFRSAAG